MCWGGDGGGSSGGGGSGDGTKASLPLLIVGKRRD